MLVMVEVIVTVKLSMKKIQTPKQPVRAPRELKPTERSAVAGGPDIGNDGEDGDG